MFFMVDFFVFSIGPIGHFHTKSSRTNNKIGLHFRRQHIIGCYIADFVCLKKSLIIEVDGGYHSQEKQIINDYLRTQDLERMGFKVMRFSNEEIMTNISNVLDTIFNEIAKPQ